MDRMLEQKQQVEKITAASQGIGGSLNNAVNTPAREQLGEKLQRIISKIQETIKQAENMHGKLNGFDIETAAEEMDDFTIHQMAVIIEKDIDRLHYCINTCNSLL